MHLQCQFMIIAWPAGLQSLGNEGTATLGTCSYFMRVDSFVIICLKRSEFFELTHAEFDSCWRLI